MHPAELARLQKEAHPERFCTDKKCLWNVARSGPCTKHMVPAEKQTWGMSNDLFRDFTDFVNDLPEKPNDNEPYTPDPRI